MKTTYILSVIIALVSFTTRAQIVNIPDPVFKNALVNFPVVDTNGDGMSDADVDTNNDGEIQVTEAEAVNNLTVGLEPITSLVGLASFVNLEYFTMVQNLFTSIDVTTMPNLRELQISINQLTSLDITQNPNLEKLDCNGNNLTSLNTSENPNLTILNCSVNDITNLDVSQNINLVEFYCGGNELTTLDVTHNLVLEKLNFASNSISEIDLSQNSDLIDLNCANNQISELEIANNPYLIFLLCDRNELVELDVNNNILIEILDCRNNQITALNLLENSSLNWLFCSNNHLSSLNIQNESNTNLINMHTQNNPNLVCIQVDDPTYAIAQECYEYSGWCKDETAIYSEDCSLGIGDVVLSEVVSLFPNPVQNTLQISAENSIIIKSIEVYDVLGKQLLQTNTVNQIDVSGLANGLFFVKIETDKGVVVKKVIKE